MVLVPTCPSMFDRKNSRCSEPGNITQRYGEIRRDTEILEAPWFGLTWLENKTQQMLRGWLFQLQRILGRQELLPMRNFSSRERTDAAYSAEVMFWQPLLNGAASRANSALGIWGVASPRSSFPSLHTCGRRQIPPGMSLASAKSFRMLG